MSLESFISAYIDTALWSSTTEEGEPLDREYSVSNLAPETLATMREDCASFYAANEAMWGDDWEDDRAGHDFWLTRNRHGAGFWDRYADGTEEGRAGRELTEAAHAYGSADLYVGDDGLIYHS